MMKEPALEHGILVEVKQFLIPERSNTAVQTLLEILRYSYAVNKKEGGNTFILECPRGYDIDGAAWQDGNVRRMASFGIRGTPVFRAPRKSPTWYRDLKDWKTEVRL